jgi:hypothetical protein
LMINYQMSKIAGIISVSIILLISAIVIIPDVAIVSFKVLERL